MRALNKGIHIGNGGKAAGKPRASETSASVRSPKAPLKTADKSAVNPNHRQDFERLLRKAANPSR